MNDSLLDYLQNLLGLSLNEAKVYLAILQRPNQPVKDIASVVQLPKSRVYEVLNLLAGRSLIEKKLGTAEFRVIAPIETLPHHIESLQTELQEKVQGINQLQGVLQDIWTDSVIGQFELGVELIPYNQAEPIFLQAIAKCEKRMLVAAEDTSTGINWRKAGVQLALAYNKKLIVRYLVSSTRLMEMLRMTFRHLPIFRGMDVLIQSTQNLHTSFVIIDDLLFVFFFGAEQRAPVVLKTQGSGMLKTYTYLFDQIWVDTEKTKFDVPIADS